MKISTILSTKGTDVVTIGPTQTIQEAMNTLGQYNFGALVVIDEANHPIGIISERDIVRLAARDKNFSEVTVDQVMTKNVITGIHQDDLRAVAYTMTERRIRHLPIVDDQKTLIGIVSIGDIVKAERNHFEGEADTLRTQIMADAA